MVLIVTPRFLILPTLFVLTLLTPVYSNVNTADARNAAIRNHEIHDEPDANDSGDCLALGELDLRFRTESNGPPNVGVVLTDPRGRRIGFDPLTKSAWDELPVAEGFIDCDASYADGSCQGKVQVCGPVTGVYKLEVIGQKPSVYSLAISARSKRVKASNGFQSSFSEADVKDIATRMGSRDILLLDYSRDPDTKIAVQIRPILESQQHAIAFHKPGTPDMQESGAGGSLANRHHPAD
jgi:hypothetical protein